MRRPATGPKVWMVLAAVWALALASPTPREATAGLPVAVAAQNDPLSMDALVEQVRRAAGVGDQPAVATLMRNNPRNSLAWVINTIERFSEAPSEALDKDMAMLRTGWKAAFSNTFFDKTESYFAQLRPELRRSRRELRDRFNLLLGPYDQVLGSEPSPERTTRARSLSIEFEAIAQSFEKVGDFYFASTAYANGGYMVDSTVIGDESDPVRAFQLLKAGLEARNRVDLKDRIHANLVTDVARLESIAVAPGGDDVDPQAKIQGVRLGDPVRADGVFEPVPSLDAAERLGYALDDVYMVWPALYLEREGSTVQFPGMSDAASVKRTGASSAEVIGTDGVAAALPFTGNVELVRTTVGAGESQRPWAFLMTVPTDREQYQGFEVNYEPTMTFMMLPIAPAASMGYDIAGTRLRILDDNMDGVYGPGVVTWGHPGMVEGEYQADVDGVLVGNAKRAVPFSELMQIGKEWFRVESLRGGLGLQLEPATLRTGKVRLDMKGLTPHSVIVRGVGPLENCFFDLAAARGPIDLPVGRYRLLQGTVRAGKRLQVQKALFLGGPATATFLVEEGKTAVYSLGAPFDIQFQVEKDASQVAVKGRSVLVTGQAGERYQRLWGYPLKPEVQMRRTGARKGSKTDRMPVVVSQSTILDDGLPVAWFPLDYRADHGLGSDQVEVQLLEKKHPLFGKLESSWR